MTNPKDQVVNWDYTFPLDVWFRRKYNIPLFSEQHLESNQFDIALEYLEDQFFESLSNKKEEKVDLNTSKSLFNETVLNVNEEKMFADLDISNIESNNDLEIKDE